MIGDLLLKLQQREHGLFGSRIISTTSAFTGNWCEIRVVVAATFTTLTIEGQTGTWTGFAWPVGAVIRGKITAITLASGTIEVKNAEQQFATLTTSLAGTNNDLVFTARDPGSKGNGITVAYVDPGAASQSLAVTVSGSAISVSLATNAGSAITSTAAQVKTAIEALFNADRLVVISNAGGNDGTGVVTALSATALAGGAG